jgi:hypothetical protein
MELNLPTDSIIDNPQTTDYTWDEFNDYSEGITSTRPADYITIPDQ